MSYITINIFWVINFDFARRELENTWSDQKSLVNERLLIAGQNSTLSFTDFSFFWPTRMCHP